VVEHSPPHQKVQGLSQFTAAMIWREKRCRIFKSLSIYSSGSCIVVEQLPHHLKVEGLIPSTALATMNGGKIIIKILV